MAPCYLHGGRDCILLIQGWIWQAESAGQGEPRNLVFKWKMSDNFLRMIDIYLHKSITENSSATKRDSSKISRVHQPSNDIPPITPSPLTPYNRQPSLPRQGRCCLFLLPKRVPCRQRRWSNTSGHVGFAAIMRTPIWRWKGCCFEDNGITFSSRAKYHLHGLPTTLYKLNGSGWATSV